jgi:uncharacterized protein YdeI (YjbR/CyaY-like superfamily)
LPAFVIRAVESRALEDDAGTLADETPQRTTALRTRRQTIARHTLEVLETITAFLTFVIVRRHDNSNLKNNNTLEIKKQCLKTTLKTEFFNIVFFRKSSTRWLDSLAFWTMDWYSNLQIRS